MKACIVVPCFNEEKRIDKSSFLLFATEHTYIHFLFVNDGSLDNTLEVLKAMASESNKFNYLDMSHNKGKASAVREGMLHAHGLGFTHIGYLDADLTIPLQTAKELIDELFKLKEKDVQIIFASRSQRFKKQAGQNHLRQTLGHTFSTLSRTVLQLPIKDTQCGAKFFDAKSVPMLFGIPFISKWIFDVEIFFRLKDHYKKDTHKHFFEFPLEYWEDNNNSKIKFRDYLKVPYNLLSILFHYRMK
jgi:glycosyltransferase involved in cell wall biosynthesis